MRPALVEKLATLLLVAYAHINASIWESVKTAHALFGVANGLG